MTATMSKPTAKPKTDPVQSMDPACVPMLGETQGQFFDRAMRALKTQYPEVNRRTVEVLKIWQQSPNDADLRTKAANRFPVEQFTHFGPRCIFLEHTIPEVADVTDPQTGKVMRPGREGTTYGRDELQKLVDWANYRIRNADQFAALSDGHMPTAEEKATGRQDADVLGWSGPFYLGLFGNVNPQYAIYSDEWVHNEDVQRFQKLQRRSPEVWCKEPIERRTMDPIAALGSETPRLDSGMNLYSLRADGQTVMRYSMGMSMALPGPDNTFVPGSGKQKYGATDMNLQQGQPNPAAGGQPDQAGGQDDAVVDAVIQAIAAQLPSIIQAVKQSMSSGDPNDGDAVPNENDPADMGGGQGSGVPRGMDDPSQELGAGPADPPAQSIPSPTAQPPAGAGPAGAPPTNPQTSDDPDQAKYAAMGQQCAMAYAAGLQKGRAMTQNYSRNSDGLEGIVARQAEQLNRAMLRISELERDKRDVECYARISEIARVHDIGDMKEHVAAIIDAEPDQVEKYCKALTLAPRLDDVTNVELFNDPAMDDREVYSRSGGTGSGAGRVSEAKIKQLKRQAEDVAIAQNHKKPGSTTFTAEFEKLCKASGIPV